MKFITAAGVIQKARRFISGGGQVQDEEVKDPKKLAEIIRQMQRRLGELEAVTPPEGQEFEVDVGANGALTAILHNVGGPIRWYVVAWTQTGGQTYPVSAPALVQDATSTSKVLQLRSYVSGKAIVRVEQAFGDVDPGITVPYVAPVVPVTSYYRMLAAQKAVTSTSLISTNLSFPIGANECWDLDFYGDGHQSSTSASMSYGVMTPAGATVNGWLFTSSTNTTVTNWLTYQVNTPNVNIGACHAGATDTGRGDWMNVRIKNGATPGTVSIAISASATLVTAKLDAKAFMRANLVTEV